MADPPVPPMLPSSGRHLAGRTEDGQLSALGYGLGSALVYGVADVAGGLATRRAHVVTILIGAYACSLPLVLLAAILGGSPIPEPNALAWSAIGGAAEAAAAGLLYTALASGTMGVASPVAAVVGATIPVAVGLAAGESVAPPQALGMLLAFGAIILVAAPQRSAAAANRRAAPLAVASGGMFAISFIAFSQAGAESDPFWVATVARVMGLAIVILLAARISLPLVPPRGLRRLVALVGLLDAIALVFLLMAYGGGRLGLTTVLISLYPAVTVVLATLFLRERMARGELIGVGFALIAVALLAVQ
jgi:drug/metabolite transporter (DMT)-like permease